MTIFIYLFFVFDNFFTSIFIVNLVSKKEFELPIIRDNIFLKINQLYSMFYFMSQNIYIIQKKLSTHLQSFSFDTIVVQLQLSCLKCSLKDEN